VGAEKSGSYDELLSNICTKRYPKTRIQRILFHLLTGFKQEEFNTLNLHGPQYLRILGFNEKGIQLLSLIKKRSELPLIMKTANFKNSTNDLLKRMLEIEDHSTNADVLGYKNPICRKSGQEYTNNVVTL
jgi:hypothetical protein